MNRRGFVAGGLLAAAVAAPAAAQSANTVVYVGGWDCGPCTVWTRDKKPAWLASSEFKRGRYIEIDSPRLKEAYQDQYWPADLRPIRDQLKNKWGTPRFIVAKDGLVVSSEWGSGEWDRAWAAIQKPAVG